MYLRWYIYMHIGSLGVVAVQSSILSAFIGG